MPHFIGLVRKVGKGQPIRDDGPKDHMVKQGTPTMGGLVVVLVVTISSLLLCNLSVLTVWLTLGAFVAFGALGFLDDFSKVNKQNSYDGLSEKQKLIGQFLISVALLLPVVLLTPLGNLEILVPFVKDTSLYLGLLFVPLATFVMVGTSNAVNFTDGLDGLAIGPILTVALTYGVLTYLTGDLDFAKYLKLVHMPYLGEVSIILAGLVGGGLGFLWYNAFPAQIFMGDTGSMAFGGILGYIAILSNQALILPICGGIFVVEAMSVIIQRYYYKLTKKRFFRMAPLHHHFELGGMPETKIIVRAWIISAILAAVSLMSLKIR